jgi:hypothetical protein
MLPAFGIPSLALAGPALGLKGDSDGLLLGLAVGDLSADVLAD